MEETILTKVLEGGLSGLLMALVMYVVVRPLIGSLTSQNASAQKQLTDTLETAAADRQASAEERQVICQRHHEFHEQMRTAMAALVQSTDALLRRANGGGR